MKLSIVTPHAVYNYGAVLQAFALYTHLQNQGHEVYMQDFPPHKGKASGSIKEKVYTVAQKFGRILHGREIIAGERSFDDFIGQFSLTEETDLPLYIVGSDQVWNPNNLDDIFSLQFASESSKKIAYAASMGVSTVAEAYEARFQQAFARLSALSAREEQTAREASRISGRACSVEVDPTFLLDKETWTTYEKPLDIRKPYVLVYLLHIPDDVHHVLKQVKRRFRCDVRMIDRTGFLRYGFPGVKAMADVGPGEFLWLVDHAQAVVTSSFHGSAFSVIFEKPLWALVNPAAPSRINHLLRIAGMQGNLEEAVDYAAVKARMAPYIESSKSYLRKETEFE